MKESIGRIWALAKRNFKEMLREPLSLVFTMGFPLLLEVLFYFIFHKQTAQFDMQYLAPRIVGFSQAFLTLFVGLLIAVDRSTAFLARLYVSKARAHEFIVAYALPVLPFALAQAVLFFLVGGIIDNSLFGIGMLYGTLTSLVTAAFFVSMGVLLGSLCNEKSIGGIASIVIAGQSVLSGMWFPLAGMDKGMIVFMQCLPFKNAADTLQNVFNGTVASFGDLGQPLLILLAYTVVTAVLAVVVFRRNMIAR